MFKSIAALTVLLMVGSVLHAAQTVVGKVTKVLDADTIVVRGVPIHLSGVDAPENRTGAGKKATVEMERYLRDKELTCWLHGQRTRDLWVGVCFTEEGHDIGAFPIENGLALDCTGFSGGRYRRLEPAGARSRLRQSRYCM